MDIVAKMVRTFRLLKIASRAVEQLPELPRVSDLNAYLARFGATALGLQNASTLDMGCGEKPRNPFNAHSLYGVDIREDLKSQPNHADLKVRYAELTIDPIPFPDNVFDYVTAYDFLEHIPRVLYAPARRSIRGVNERDLEDA